MIREIKTLIVVAREGSFAAAAEKVGLTQAAVSAQMFRLEAELGLQLFDRQGRTARLNPIGKQTVSRGQELIQLYDNLGNSSPFPEAALVTIGAIASVQRSLLPDVLAVFHRQYPQCRTRIVPGLSVNLLEEVDAGESDLAVIWRPPFTLHKGMRWTTLSVEPFHLIVHPDLPNDDWKSILASQPFIRHGRASWGVRLIDRFLQNMNIPVNEVCEVDELEAIFKLVANKVGVALVPKTRYQDWTKWVRAIDLGPHTFHREIGMVHLDKSHLSEHASLLAKLLRDKASADLP